MAGLRTQENLSHWPLSQSQKMILTGQQMQPNDPLYNMVITFELGADLCANRFELAFEALVQQADIMRMTFNSEKEQPVQILQNAIPEPLEHVDFSASDDPEQAAQTWINAARSRQFNLQQCLYHSALLKLSDQGYIWYLNQHHLITDAWSVSVQFNALQTYYASLSADQQAVLPSLPSYCDYLKFEQGLQDSPVFEQAQAYWQAICAKSFQPTTFYRSPSASVGGRTARICCPLGSQRSAALRTLISKTGFVSLSRHLSLMQIFATVLFSYLYRVSGNNLLAIGTPSHARSSQKLKDTVGMLINIFPLDVAIDKEESFSSLFAKVSKVNQRLMINALPGANDPKNNRVFDVILNYISSSFSTFADKPTRSEWIHADYGDRNHLLRLQVHDFDQTNEFTLYFDLNQDVFVGDEKNWVADHFLILLDALLEDPEQKLTQPALMQVQQQRAAIDFGNDNRSIAIRQCTVAELFAEQVIQTPDAVAVICAHQEYSYTELKLRSDDFLGQLLALGVRQQDVVAIYLPRGLDAIACVLACCQMGAVFLPIDSTLPCQRIEFMLTDAGAQVVVTNHALIETLNLPHAQPPEVLLADNMSPLTDTLAERALWPSAKLSDLAYIIYTSGSTGKPKGVRLEQLGLSQYCQWARGYYLDKEPLNFALFTSLSFDLTLTSLFVPLLSGASVVVYPEIAEQSEILLRRVIEDNQVDAIKLTPAHLSLIQNMDFASSKLQALIVGGDDFKTDCAQLFSTYFGDKIAIYNEYGPTEATVACSVHRFNRHDDKAASVPIGKPIAGAAIYVLDENLHAVPQGGVGEIYVGGRGLAREYINLPEQTASRFIDNPFQQSGRLYKTGDLAMWDSNGNLHYLGRRDQQVKIKGVRVETNEVEAAMATISSITEVVVEAKKQSEVTNTELNVTHCITCGLAENHPSAQIDETGQCRLCRHYQKEQKHAQAYFRDQDDLRALIRKIKHEATAKQDCIMLLSGGKDSSYALCRLVDMGLTPLVFTLDNGYISEGAKANIKRLVDSLGLELVIGETPAMNSIFVESLTRFSNVCNGCFKTIYTLSMNLAKQRGIKVICTGLSRGQVFETRVAHLFQQGRYDADDIDTSIIEARKAYHRADDQVSRALDIKIFKSDEIFDEIQYLDFYRYTDVTLAEMMEYLQNKAPWIRPADTGRSTNCLINDAGIYVHKLERGYHNYGLPYSWDVRLGHKDRDAALAELDDDIDPEKVTRILNEVGYTINKPNSDLAQTNKLVAYYVAAQAINHDDLVAQLAKMLPKEFIPSQFVWLKALPLTRNGKVDRSALPNPLQSREHLQATYCDPVNEIEHTLALIWSQMLNIEKIGTQDNFFSLGGDSIVIIQIVTAARNKGIDITPQQMFENPTIESLAKVARALQLSSQCNDPVTGEVPLLPIQQRYLSRYGEGMSRYCHAVTLETTDALNHELLTQAFAQVLAHHDGLRSRFKLKNGTWRQVILPVEQAEIDIFPCDKALEPESGDYAIQLEQLQYQQSQRLNIQQGRLISLALIPIVSTNMTQLSIVINHLVIDAVSWWILLGDLEKAYTQLMSGKALRLGNKTTSMLRWAEYQRQYPSEHSITPLETDVSKGGRLDTFSLSLSAAQTMALIHKVPQRCAVTVEELLVTAMAAAWQQLGIEPSLCLHIEEHGRENDIEGINLLRTIGWLTQISSVHIPVFNKAEIGEIIRQVKSALSHQQNNNSNATIGSQNPTVVLFNYMGQWQRFLRSNSEFRFVHPIKLLRNGAREHDYSLELNAIVFDDCLRIEWTFDSGKYQEDEIKTLANGCLQHIAALVDFCLTTEKSSFSPEDFPDADIDKQELDDIFAEFGESP